LLRARGASDSVGQGSLQDYAYVAEGLLGLARIAQSEAQSADDYALVRRILVDAWRRFHTQHGWRRAGVSLIPMLQPSSAMSDGPIPSPSAAILAATLETAAFLHDQELRGQAEAAMRRTGPILAEQPFFYASHLAVLARFAYR
jgi:uncharacterized protein YyaL (SSP411 family)